MARKRVIVSIGEAVLCEYPDRSEPGGLALTMAAAAVKAGHRGVCISRLGQDAAGDEVLRQARALGIDVDSMQSDPDLATGRLVVRTVAGRTTRTLTPSAAFDNLQWDFDMVDTAQHADAVVFGHLAQRNGQSKSVIKQFLAECTSALRGFDLTNRAADAIDRGEAASALEFCEVIVADATAMKALAPSAGGDAEAAANALLRAGQVQVVLLCVREGGGERVRAITADATSEPSAAFPMVNHDDAVISLMSGIL